MIVRLKYGTDIAVEPSKLTPAIFTAEANLIAVSAAPAVVGFQEGLICISDDIFSKYVELNILIKLVEAYVAPIVIGFTAVFIAIPVPAEKFVVITGDDVVLPDVIDNPLPTVTLFVRLKYGILLRPEPEPVIIPDSFKLPDISTSTGLVTVPILTCPPSRILKQVA